MDFPEDLTTNIYLIGQITEIHWSQWSLVETQDVSSLKQTFRSQLATSSILHELREHHAHVFHDADIWLFRFSTSLGNEIDETLLSHGYTELSRGSLNVDADSSLITSSVSLPSPDSVSNENAPRQSDLYKKAMSALCASLCHDLVSGKSDKWMPLEDFFCIDMSTVGQSGNLKNSTTRKINFESDWDSEGCLNISTIFSDVERLCQVAAVPNKDLRLGTSILLLPSGIHTRYHGRLQEAPSDLIQNSKLRCLRFLNSGGLSLSDPSEWIVVELDREGNEHEAFLTIWPTQYAMFKMGNATNHPPDLVAEPEMENDPFTRAETWYLGRTARAAEVEIIQGEIELQAQQQSSQRDISDPDVTSEIASPAFREILAPQDATGVYPTPPDGLLSQTPASNVHQDASPGFTTAGRIDDPSGFSDDANEELFDDMEMDLVGEADFNFFDEPGTNELSQPVGRSEVADGNVSSSSLLPKSQSVAQTRLHAENRETDSVIVPHDKDGSLNLNSGNHSSASSTSPETLETPNHSQIQEKIPPAPENRGSYNPLTLTELDFEGKYGAHGRFGYTPVDGESFASQNRAKHEIFKIGIPPIGGDSDNDEDMSEDQHDLQVGYDIDEDLKRMGGSFEKREDESVNTPDSSMEPDEQLKLNLPPSEMFFPQDYQKSFFQSVDPPKAAVALLEPSSFIEIAQLVGDQSGWENSATSCHRRTIIQPPPHLQYVVSGSFPSARPCRLKDLAKSENEQVVMTKDSMIGIQRYGTLMDISSSAIQFWEKLSLSPRSGPKNLHAFSIFPMKDYLVRPMKTFMEMMKGAYQDCNLGKHTLENPQQSYPHGLVPVPQGGLSPNSDVFVRLVKHIVSLRLDGGNTVIYILNNGDHAAIPGMCKYFLCLFYAYRKALEKEDIRNPNDLVLQIVPFDMVFSSHRLVAPSPNDYKRLAFQVYDRCTLGGSDGQIPYVCAPALSLASSTPQPFDLKFTVDPLENREFLHLAYKWVSRQQWLSAAWTNNSGTIKWNAAFWLSEDEDIEMSLPQAAKAMLDTTDDIIKSQRTSYHVYISKDGRFENYELEMWKRLGPSEMSITLLEIESDPSLMVFPPQSIVSSPLTSDFRTIPETGSDGLSPEVSGHTSIPGETNPSGMLENDPSARLMDVTDETWMMVTEKSHRTLNTKSGNSSPQPTGYLMKRAGTQNEDGILILKVNVLHDSEPRRVRMKELLTIYRNLALLARIRNVSDPVEGILPIHVAIVRGAHLALGKAMVLGERP